MELHGLRRLVGRVSALVLVLSTFVPAAGFAASSLRFRGNGSGDIDRVKVPIDDPATANPGPPADVGAGDFTIEFWMKAAAADNTAGPVACGANVAWINGNIVVDRDRFGLDRKFGVSIAGGRIVFGVSGEATGDLTICGGRNVLDDAWHHVAVARERATGRMWIFVDGLPDAQGDGPGGDVSYPDGAAAGAPNDPYLVFGAEKHDAGAAFPSYSGFLDEIRVSSVLRYAGPFTRPRAPFTSDADTAALYHLDEGTGILLADSSGAAGGPSDGQRQFGGSPAGPDWALSDAAPLGGTPTLTLTPLTTAVSSPVQVTHAGDGSNRLFIVEQSGSVDITAVCGTEPLTVALADGFGGNSWRLITKAEFEDEASKCPNIEEVLYTNAEGDQQRAISDINSLVAQGVDAIVVFPDFGAAELPAIRAAHDAGVAIVPYLADPGGTPGEDYVEYIDEDRAAAGTAWADWVGGVIPEGNIVFLGGIPGNPSSLAFIEGLKAGLEAHPGVTLLTDQPVDTNWDPAEYQRVTAGLLTQFDQIDAIVSDYGTGSVGALRAYEAANEPLVPLAALASSNELGCLWEEKSADNPDFQYMSLDGTTQVVRIALGTAVAAAQGLDNPFPNVVVLPTFVDTVNGNPPVCQPDLPPDADLSSSLPLERLQEIFSA